MVSYASGLSSCLLLLFSVGFSVHLRGKKNTRGCGGPPKLADFFFGGCVGSGLGVACWTIGGREGLLGANDFVVGEGEKCCVPMSLLGSI